MTGKAIESTASAVPDLVRTPSLDITAEDVALPRLYIGQFMTKACQDRLVNHGDIFLATGKDDGDPRVLWGFGSGDPGPVFYVIGLEKGKSVQDSDSGELLLFDYDDPTAPPEAWITYKYTIAIPAAEWDVPIRYLLTKTGRPAAQQINTVLKKDAQSPSWVHAFELTTDDRENKKGKYWVPKIKEVEGNPDHVDRAGNLFLQIAGVSMEARASGAEPAI